MKLPSYVLECLNALEAAGYPAYAVGGCVRDACLGLQPHDYDICTAAVPQQTEAVFAGKKLVLAGEKHGTVGVVTAGAWWRSPPSARRARTGTTGTRTG